MDTCLPYVSSLSGVKGKRRLILVPAHVLYVSSCVLVFPGSLYYYFREKRFLRIKDHFWVTGVDGYGWISAIGGSFSILGQCFSNYDVDVNHLVNRFRCSRFEMGPEIFAFLGNSLVMPMLLVQRPHLEQQGFCAMVTKCQSLFKFFLACNKKRKIIMQWVRFSTTLYMFLF